MEGATGANAPGADGVSGFGSEASILWRRRGFSAESNGEMRPARFPIVLVLVVVLDSFPCPLDYEDRSLRSLRTRTIALRQLFLSPPANSVFRDR